MTDFLAVTLLVETILLETLAVGCADGLGEALGVTAFAVAIPSESIAIRASDTNLRITYRTT